MPMNTAAENATSRSRASSLSKRRRDTPIAANFDTADRNSYSLISPPPGSIRAMAKTTAKTAKPGRRVLEPATGPARDAAEHVYGVPVPEALHDAIEEERGNLGKLDSLLGCLAIALEHGRSDDCKYDPYYPDLAVMARAMVQGVMNALDSLTLSKLLLAQRTTDEADRRKRTV